MCRKVSLPAHEQFPPPSQRRHPCNTARVSALALCCFRTRFRQRRGALHFCKYGASLHFKSDGAFNAVFHHFASKYVPWVLKSSAGRRQQTWVNSLSAVNYCRFCFKFVLVAFYSVAGVNSRFWIVSLFAMALKYFVFLLG